MMNKSMQARIRLGHWLALTGYAMDPNPAHLK